MPYKNHADKLAAKKGHYQRNKRNWKQYKANWLAKDPNRAKENYRRHDLKRHHGITVEQYEQMLRSQGGCCAICRKPQQPDKRRMAVDHDHTTGANRGLLCISCNRLLGCAMESHVILFAASDYLLAHGAPGILQEAA